MHVDLAHGEEPGQLGHPVEVGGDAAARVVLGGRHRDAIDGGVDADLAAGGGDRREAFVEPFAHVGGVEEDVVVDPAGRFGHAPADGVGDHVARREVLERVDARHHPFAGGVEQDRSLAANGLRHEGLLTRGVRAAPHHRRMELHELDVAQRQARRAARAPCRRR